MRVNTHGNPHIIVGSSQSAEPTSHAGDCTIYRALINGRPVDGVCTCGYGWSIVRKGEGDWSEMYSAELKERLEVLSRNDPTPSKQPDSPRSDVIH